MKTLKIYMKGGGIVEMPMPDSSKITALWVVWETQGYCMLSQPVADVLVPIDQIALATLEIAPTHEGSGRQQ